MTYAIAAAGTGGHVFPALAVGEALVAAGVDPGEVHFLGGGRLEAQVFPGAGFPFHQVEVRGLQRSLSPSNLGLPLVVARAVARSRRIVSNHGVRVMLGVGGYITPPAIAGARLVGAKTMVSEQNASAGLGIRMASLISHRVFGSFPVTAGVHRAEWVGNPIRAAISNFDRTALRSEALDRFRLDGGRPVVGVFGGSLGAGPINQAVAAMVRGWSGPDVQFLHLVGERFLPDFDPEGWESRWRVVGFEDRMDLFYAVSDLVVARAGGAVAELSATGTPAILIPGEFGSGHHQVDNARVFDQAGAAVVLAQSRMSDLEWTVRELVTDPHKLATMRETMAGLAKPKAADTIARAMMDAHG